MTKKDDFDLQNFLPYLLNQAAEESSLAFQNIYKDRYGMLRTEWRVLFHLGVFGRLAAQEICERPPMHKTKNHRAGGVSLTHLTPATLLRASAASVVTLLPQTDYHE